MSKHDSLFVPYFERSFGRQIRLAVRCNSGDVTEPQTVDHLLDFVLKRIAGPPLQSRQQYIGNKTLPATPQAGWFIAKQSRFFVILVTSLSTRRS